MRSKLRGKDRDSSVLSTDANTEDESGSKQSLPRVSECRADGRGGQTGASDKDLSSTTKVVVQRVNDPCTTVMGQYGPDMLVTRDTHIPPAVKKMIELTKPKIHSSLPCPSIPNSVRNDRAAPLEPV